MSTVVIADVVVAVVVVVVITVVGVSDDAADENDLYAVSEADDVSSLPKLLSTVDIDVNSVDFIVVKVGFDGNVESLFETSLAVVV